MKTEDIRDALIQRCKLTCLSYGISVIMPNIEYDIPLPLPRIEMNFAGINRENSTVKGGSVLLETGRFNPVIAVERHSRTKTANDYADLIAALFPKAHQMVIDDGKITIRDVATIRSGFPDKTSWRVPLTIPYRADAT